MREEGSRASGRESKRGRLKIEERKEMTWRCIGQIDMEEAGK